MADYAPGMRTIIRGEEWMVMKVEINSMDNRATHCVDISPLMKDRKAIFLEDLEEIQITDPARIRQVRDDSSNRKRTLL